MALRRHAELTEPVLPWLLVVARNALANRARSRERARVKTEAAAGARRRTRARSADALGERDALMRALATLPAADREALCLVAWDDLPLDQAAHVAGVPAPPSACAYPRARRRLATARRSLPPRPPCGDHMSADLFERMRALDPAADADLTPPEDLLTQLLDEWPAATPRVALAGAAAGSRSRSRRGACGGGRRVRGARRLVRPQPRRAGVRADQRRGGQCSTSARGSRATDGCRRARLALPRPRARPCATDSAPMVGDFVTALRRHRPLPQRRRPGHGHGHRKGRRR